MSTLVAEGSKLDLEQLAGCEASFSELDCGVICFYVGRELMAAEVEQFESIVLSQDVTLTSPIIQTEGVVCISFQKRVPPLLIIGAAAALIIGTVIGWQVFTTVKAGVPLWVWLVGGAAVLYLFLKSDTGESLTRTIVTYAAK